MPEFSSLQNCLIESFKLIKLLTKNMSEIEMKMFCRGLNRKQSADLLKEYGYSLSDVKYQLENDYKHLKKFENTIGLLLAMSIYYNKIILNLNAADKFFSKINKMSSVKNISLGKYDLNENKSANFKEIKDKFIKIMYRFQIDEHLFSYNSISEFMENIKNQIMIWEEDKTGKNRGGIQKL